MQNIKENTKKAIITLLIFTIICGVFYTAFVTVIAQVFFPEKANGSIIEVDGVKYGSSLLGQYYNNPKYLSGRIMNLDFTTFTNSDGEALMYSYPSNLSPSSAEFEALVSQRVEQIRSANPQMKDVPIPVDLITVSASGLDPHISPAAALYQAPRIANERSISVNDVENIIEKCTEGRFLGIFGEETVNVLKVNLMLDGILK